MPYKTTKLKSGRYRVTSPNGTKAKATTKEKAAAQTRLLNAVEHSDWRPTGTKKKKGKPKKYGMPFVMSR